MSKEIRRRRGTTEQHSDFVGAPGEITIDTTKKTVVVHDGSTPGGIPLAKEKEAIIQANNDVLYASDMAEYMKSVPMAGARQPRVITAPTGLWYGGHTTHGDWSGTLQERKDGTFGSGGPAQLEWAPSGENTLFNAGRIMHDSSPTYFYSEIGFPSPADGVTYEVAIRRAFARRASFTGATWSPASLTITFVSSPSYTFTGNDWVNLHCLTNLDDDEIIDLDVCTGWYRPASYNSTTKKMVLTADEELYGPTFCPNTLAGAVDGTIFQANDCTYYTDVILSAEGLLQKSGANFPSPGTDDTVELFFNDGSSTYAKIYGQSSPDELELHEDLGAEADFSGTVKVFTRGSFEKREVSTWDGADMPVPYAQTGSPVYEVMRVDMATPFSSSPQWGDYFFIYITDGASPLPASHPEDVPTASADYSLSSWWPYFSFVKSTHTSGKSISGNGNNPAADIGSDMNHYWWGSFLVPRETFLSGASIEITSVLDVTYFGTPFFIEVMVIPGFDPEADFGKDHTLRNDDRLSNNAMIYSFQSSIIRGVEQSSTIIPMWIRLTGKSAYIQTIGAQQGLNPGSGDNSSQQWFCEFLPGPPGNNGTEESHIDRLPCTKGPISHIMELDAEEPYLRDFTKKDYMYTVLIKAEHPGLYGKMGYHGTYSGEPYSVTTGNGGTLLHFPGNVASIRQSDDTYTGFSRGTALLPLGPRFRVGNFQIVWNPGDVH